MSVECRCIYIHCRILKFNIPMFAYFSVLLELSLLAWVVYCLGAWVGPCHTTQHNAQLKRAQLNTMHGQLNNRPRGESINNKCRWVSWLEILPHLNREKKLRQTIMDLDYVIVFIITLYPNKSSAHQYMKFLFCLEDVVGKRPHRCKRWSIQEMHLNCRIAAAADDIIYRNNNCYLSKTNYSGVMVNVLSWCLILTWALGLIFSQPESCCICMWCTWGQPLHMHLCMHSTHVRKKQSITTTLTNHPNFTFVKDKRYINHMNMMRKAVRNLSCENVLTVQRINYRWITVSILMILVTAFMGRTFIIVKDALIMWINSENMHLLSVRAVYSVKISLDWDCRLLL